MIENICPNCEKRLKTHDDIAMFDTGMCSECALEQWMNSDDAHRELIMKEFTNTWCAPNTSPYFQTI